jgi:hypothetical protein
MCLHARKLPFKLHPHSSHAEPTSLLVLDEIGSQICTHTSLVLRAQTLNGAQQIKSKPLLDHSIGEDG